MEEFKNPALRRKPTALPENIPPRPQPLLLGTLGPLVLATLTHGQTCDGDDLNNDWITAENGSGDAAPNNNGTAAIIFSGTTGRTSNPDAPWNTLP